MMSKGRNMSEFYPDVVKNVIVSRCIYMLPPQTRLTAPCSGQIYRGQEVDVHVPRALLGRGRLNARFFGLPP